MPDTSGMHDRPAPHDPVEIGSAAPAEHRERQRELVLCRYVQAFDRGDLAALAAALAQAADDPELDRQIMAVNTALHSEAGIRPLAEPAALAARHSHNGKLFTETVGAAAASGSDTGAQSRSLEPAVNGRQRRDEPMEVSRPRLGPVWRALVGSAQACSNWWRGSGQRWRLGVAMAVVALLLGSVLATPAGRAVATELLGQFRVQKFALITVAPQDPTANFASLEQLGTLHVPEDMQEGGTQATSVAAAAEQVGFTVQQPSHLPSGLSADPQVHTTAASTVSFTVDRDKALAYLAEQGHSDVNVPEALDDSTIHLTISAAVLLVYGDDAGQVSLVVGQSPSPTVTVSGGATLEQFRSFLLSVPGLPADTIDQLQAIDDWTQTLPIPVPQDASVSRHVTVDGAAGVSVQDAQTRHGVVLWQRDGMVYGVAGSYGEQELLAVAASLQ